MQAYIKYRAYFDKKVNASKLKKAGYVYVLQSKADHQGTKFFCTEFRWIRPYFTEKVLPNNSYLIRKILTKHTQRLQRLQLGLVTPKQHLTNVQITPQERKSDSKVIIKHDDLYART